MCLICTGLCEAEGHGEAHTATQESGAQAPGLLTEQEDARYYTESSLKVLTNSMSRLLRCACFVSCITVHDIATNMFDLTHTLCAAATGCPRVALTDQSQGGIDR